MIDEKAAVHAIVRYKELDQEDYTTEWIANMIYEILYAYEQAKQPNAESSRGRTPDFESRNGGSSPSLAAKQFIDVMRENVRLRKDVLEYEQDMDKLLTIMCPNKHSEEK